MKTLSNVNECSGEQLLLMRIFKPQMAGLIEQELERRSGTRKLASQARATAARPALRLVRNVA
jgi:hypothetical protein